MMIQTRWVLSKKFRFEASHQLKGHDGKCARLHGHSWVMTVIVIGDRLQQDGPKKNMLMDYGDIKSIVQPLVDQYLDHHHLNDTLHEENPTSEFIAKWMYNRLMSVVASGNTYLHSVIVEETCTSACEYKEQYIAPSL